MVGASKPKAQAFDPLAVLERVSLLALELPETTRLVHGSSTHGSHAQFLVRKRTFAYFLNNHHGDGIVSLCCKVLPGENQALAKSQPLRFYLPAYIGSRGWIALRVDRGKIEWQEVAELLRGSYLLVAPKGLASQVG